MRIGLARGSDLGLVVNDDELRDLIAPQAEVKTQNQRIGQTGLVVGAVVAGPHDGVAVRTDGDARTPYLERFIHGALYESRSDVMAVCHNHTLSILPFSISRSVRLRPVIHTGAVLGGEVPVWNIADEFGTETNMLVINMEQGRSLARTVGQGRLALMRGHGSVVVGSDVPAVVSACMGMDKNAKVQFQALQLGEFIPLAPGEINRPWVAPSGPPLPDRAWEALVRRVAV